MDTKPGPVSSVGVAVDFGCKVRTVDVFLLHSILSGSAPCSSLLNLGILSLASVVGVFLPLTLSDSLYSQCFVPDSLGHTVV